MSKCCYKDCPVNKNTLKQNTGQEMINFPRPKHQFERCKEWISCLGRPNFTVANVNYHTCICPRHFVGGKGPSINFPTPIPYGLTESEFIETMTPKEVPSQCENDAVLVQNNEVSYENIKIEAILEEEDHTGFSKLISFVTKEQSEPIGELITPHEVECERNAVIREECESIEDNITPLEVKCENIFSLENVKCEAIPAEEFQVPVIESSYSLPSDQVIFKVDSVQQYLLRSLCSLAPQNWTYGKVDSMIRIVKFNPKPIVGSIVLLIDSDMKTCLLINNKILQGDHPLVSGFPDKIKSETELKKCLIELDSWQLCEGTPETDLLTIFLVRDLGDIGYVDFGTVFGHNCDLLIKKTQCLRCVSCGKVRLTLLHKRSKIKNEKLELLPDSNRGKLKRKKLRMINRNLTLKLRRMENRLKKKIMKLQITKASFPPHLSKDIAESN